MQRSFWSKSTSWCIIGEPQDAEEQSCREILVCVNKCVFRNRIWCGISYAFCKKIVHFLLTEKQQENCSYALAEGLSLRWWMLLHPALVFLSLKKAVRKMSPCIVLTTFGWFSSLKPAVEQRWLGAGSHCSPFVTSREGEEPTCSWVQVPASGLLQFSVRCVLFCFVVLCFPKLSLNYSLLKLAVTDLVSPVW